MHEVTIDIERGDRLGDALLEESARNSINYDQENEELNAILMEYSNLSNNNNKTVYVKPQQTNLNEFLYKNAGDKNLIRRNYYNFNNNSNKTTFTTQPPPSYHGQDSPFSTQNGSASSFNNQNNRNKNINTSSSKPQPKPNACVRFFNMICCCPIRQNNQTSINLQKDKNGYSYEEHKKYLASRFPDTNPKKNDMRQVNQLSQ